MANTKYKMELTSKIEESLKSLEDYEDLCLLRDEKLAARKEPVQSLNEVVKKIERKNSDGF